MVRPFLGRGGGATPSPNCGPLCDLFFGAASRTVQQVIDDLRKLFGCIMHSVQVGGVPVAAWIR